MIFLWIDADYWMGVDIVRNIFVNNVTIQNSENGPRIKTWGGANRGYGVVDNIFFTNFVHSENDSPITIGALCPSLF